MTEISIYAMTSILHTSILHSMSNFFKKTLPLLIVLIQMMTACDNASKNPTKASSSSPIEGALRTQESSQAVTKSAEKGFYKHLKGTIGDFPVTLDLVKTVTGSGHEMAESWVGFSGYYAYDKYGEPIMLTGTLDSAGMIVLQEFSTTGDNAATFTGNMTADGVFVGTWQDTSRKRSLPVMLKETYADGAIGFESHEFVDSFKLFTQLKNSPVAQFGMDILYPSPNTEGGLLAFLKTEIFNAVPHDIEIGNEAKKRSDQTLAHIADLQKAERDTFFKLYRETVGDTKPDSMMDYFPQNYVQSSQMQVLHNGNGLLSLAYSAYNYSGGAHGYHGTSLQVYDLKNKKVLKLGDVLKGNYQKTLSAVLAKAVRRHFGLKPNQPLTEVLFENKIEATENFAVTRKGIVFQYNPYEIAAYAMGEIQLFIPFEELKGFVKNF
jgi:hypothetical protein